MRREVRKFLFDISVACKSIDGFLHGADLQAYLRDEYLRSAVERKLIIIGEALTQALRLDPGLAEGIFDTSQIIAFRNVLVHGYSRVEDDTVYGIVRRWLPKLRDQVDSLLARSSTE